MKALQIPYLGGSRLVHQLLCRALDVPETTAFYPGFYSRGGRLFCGKCVSLSDTVFFDYAPVYLEDGVSFSFRNVVLTSTHDLHDFPCVVARPVILEQNVWITTNVTILGGVRIGQNTVVGAGSVVTSDLPANVLAAGNPCRPLKTIVRSVGMSNVTQGT